MELASFLILFEQGSDFNQQHQTMQAQREYESKRASEELKNLHMQLALQQVEILKISTLF
jgi:hypothetical protein